MEFQSSKEKYRHFCNEVPGLPLFLQPWWMDAVCKENDRWEVFLFEDKEVIRGVFVCYFTKKFGLKFVIQPQLTQYNGIWLLHEDSMSANEKLHFEKKAVGNLTSQLFQAGFDYFNQNFPTSFENWLPLYWQSFKQTTRYSYQINGLKNPDALFEKFSYAKQKQIRKSEKSLKVSFEMTGEQFFNHLTNYYSSKNEKVSFTQDFFLNLHEACKTRNQGRIISVEDADGIVHAALFIVWDGVRAYNLISSIHPDQKASGGSSLVVFEAIKSVSDIVEVFDFEGSMNQNIENSFSQFGTEQIPYFNIKKYNSLIVKAVLPLMKL